MADSIERLAYRKVSDYVLVRAIGRGTHYTLYQAVDPRREQMAVIKMLHVFSGKPTTEGEPDLAAVLEARLEREAHALSSMSHPNIPEIYETGEQDGHPFLVMEYLIGHPLRQHLDQRAMPLEKALAILEQVASAVDAVHAAGILHRDIRPSNVMILNNGEVKLVEFGLARQPGDTTVTLMGALVGEPAYMAPEQLRNQPASPQSDLWALGVMMYEMLTGKPPFEGANFQMVAHQVIMGQPAPVPGLSAGMQAVLSRALEKEPAKRYPNAQEMVSALRKASGAVASTRPRSDLQPRPSVPRATAGQPSASRVSTSQTSVSRPSVSRPPSARRPAWVGVMLFIIAAAVLGGLVWEYQTHRFSTTALAATLPHPSATHSTSARKGHR